MKAITLTLISLVLISVSPFYRGDFGPILFLTALTLFCLAAIIGRRNRGSL